MEFYIDKTLASCSVTLTFCPSCMLWKRLLQHMAVEASYFFFTDGSTDVKKGEPISFMLLKSQKESPAFLFFLIRNPSFLELTDC